MANNAQTIFEGVERRFDLTGGIIRAWHAIATRAHSALWSMQTARMMSVLHDMSDDQLAQIGIARSDIPNYAEDLMKLEKEGGSGRST